MSNTIIAIIQMCNQEMDTTHIFIVQYMQELHFQPIDFLLNDYMTKIYLDNGKLWISSCYETMNGSLSKS